MREPDDPRWTCIKHRPHAKDAKSATVPDSILRGLGDLGVRQEISAKVRGCALPDYFNCPKDLRQPGLVEPLLRDGDHGVVEFRAVQFLHVDSVTFKKGEGRAHCRALVAVEEWLVLGDMKRIGGGDRSRVALAVVVSGFRLHQRRVQQAGLTEPIKTPVPFK